MSDWETFGPLLHGTARAWRLKLDARLKPMGLSQAKWRTLLHLSLADTTLTQAEVAARLGIEEPTLVNLLHRLEREGWVARRNAPHDRRCKTVHLGKQALLLRKSMRRQRSFGTSCSPIFPRQNYKPAWRSSLAFAARRTMRIKFLNVELFSRVGAARTGRRVR